jgi:hypothetical protein
MLRAGLHVRSNYIVQPGVCGRKLLVYEALSY